MSFDEGAPALAIALVRMLLTRPLRFTKGTGAGFTHGLPRGPSTTRAPHLSGRGLLHRALASRSRHRAFARALRHQFGRGRDARACAWADLRGASPSMDPKEYDNVQLFGLAEKIRRCAFVVAISSYGRSQLYRLVDHQHWPKVQSGSLRARSMPISRRHVRPAPTARRLVCVGRLCEQKGQLLLVEAAHRLAAQGDSISNWCWLAMANYALRSRR